MDASPARLAERSDNLCVRLGGREVQACLGGGEGGAESWKRLSYECVGFRAHAYDVAAPSCILRRFTPDGRYLLALDRKGRDLLVYPFRGWQRCVAAGDAPPTPTCLTDWFGSAVRIPVAEAVRDRFGSSASVSSIADGNGRSAASVYLRDMLLVTPCSRYVILGGWTVSRSRRFDDAETAAAVPRSAAPFAHAAAPSLSPARRSTPLPGCPAMQTVFIYLVDLQLSQVVDVYALADDLVNFDAHSGVHLYGSDLLLVTALAQQTLHLLQIRPVTSPDPSRPTTARLFPVMSFGPHCRPDDATVIARQYRRERDFRRQKRRVVPLRLEDLEPTDDTGPGEGDEAHAAAVAAAAAAAIDAGERTESPPAEVPVMAGNEGAAAASEASSTPSLPLKRHRTETAAAARLRAERIEWRLSPQACPRATSPVVFPATTAAAVSGSAMAMAAQRIAYGAARNDCFLTGVKQRVLAYLYRKRMGKGADGYGRFAASFNAIVGMVLVRAALLDAEHVLLRYMPAATAARMFQGSTAQALLTAPWFVSGVSITGLQSPDIAAVQAMLQQSVGTATAASTPPSGSRMVDRVGDFRPSLPDTSHTPSDGSGSGGKTRGQQAALAVLSSTMYVVYNFKTTEVVAASHGHSRTFTALYQQHPEWVSGTDDGWRHHAAAIRDSAAALVAPVAGREACSASGRVENCSAGGVDALDALRGGSAAAGWRRSAVAHLPIATLSQHYLLCGSLMLPLPCQPHDTSPWLDRTLFSYDESKLWSADGAHPATCSEYPAVRLVLRRSGAFRWKLNPEGRSGLPAEAQPMGSAAGRAADVSQPPPPRPPSRTSSPPRSHSRRSRKYVQYVFHPQLPFAISILWSASRPPVTHVHHYG